MTVRMITEELKLDKKTVQKICKWVLHQGNTMTHTEIPERQFLMQNWIDGTSSLFSQSGSV